MSYFPSISQFALYAQSMNGSRFMALANRQGEVLGQRAVSGQENVQGQRETQPAEEIFPGSRSVSKKGDFDTYECQTCKNRKYQDGSNDPGVSFKTPTTISPERAAFAIRSHEAEHVAHARLKALEEDKEIVSQSVSYRTGICPECGKTFMAGGNTRTVLRSAPETYQQEPVKKGIYLDLTA